METVVTTLIHTITLNYIDLPHHSPTPDFEIHFTLLRESIRARILKRIQGKRDEKWLHLHAPRAVDDFEQFSDPTTYEFSFPNGANPSLFINILVRRVEQLLTARGRLQKTQMTNHAKKIQYYIYLR